MSTNDYPLIENATLGNVMSAYFPIGSIQFTIDGAPPALPGVWKLISEGRCILSAGSNFSAGSKGGSDVIPLESLPSHRHKIDHGHDTSVSNAGSHGHTGSVNAAGHHAHSGATHAAGQHGHTGATGVAGNHSHTIPVARYAYTTGSNQYAIDLGVTSGNSTLPAGDHQHSLSINASGNHAHAVDVYGGGEHSHSLTINPIGDHSHDVTVSYHSGSSESTGDGEPYLPPYLALSVWQRIE